MQNAKSGIPLAAHFGLSYDLSSLSNDEFDNMSRVQYSSAVGSLTYGFSRYVRNSGKEYWKVV